MNMNTNIATGTWRNFKNNIFKKDLFSIFCVFTIATFVIGVIVKVILMAWQINMIAGFAANDWKTHALFNGQVISVPLPKSNIIEASSGMGLQILLVIITLIAYPHSIIKLVKMVKNPNEQWTAKIQKRLFIEYLSFLIVFVLFDLSGISIIVIEHAPMTGWVIFSLISIFIPTSFALGSLMFLRKTKLVLAK